MKEDDGCSADGGQQGGTKLAADTQIVAVLGTTCSSSALGVADKIMTDTGIPLISPSNTNPGLTERRDAPAVLPAHRAQRPHPGGHRRRLRVRSKARDRRHRSTTRARTRRPSPRSSAELRGRRSARSRRPSRSTSTDTDFKSLLATIGKDTPDMLYFPDFDPACELIAAQAKETAGLENTVSGGLRWLPRPRRSSKRAAARSTGCTHPVRTCRRSRSGLLQDEFLPAYERVGGYGPTSAYPRTRLRRDEHDPVAAIEAVAITDDDGSSDDLRGRR